LTAPVRAAARDPAVDRHGVRPAAALRCGFARQGAEACDGCCGSADRQAAAVPGM